MDITSQSRERALAWITLIMLAGLVARLCAANGALWLDEAWSAVFAYEAETPRGVFQSINHDNNHHLNSLWLQWVGLGAHPIAARALSIVSGAAAIGVAGLIGLRRGMAAGLVTALLFAFSPLLVTLGSEARGYAPMTLMALICIWYVDRWLDGDSKAEQPLVLAACFYIGVLFQLTMIFAACAIIGWPLLTIWRRDGLREAVRRTARLFGVPLAAIVAATLLAFGPSLTDTVEFRFGSYQPFTMLLFLKGLVGLIGFSVGVTWTAVWLLAAATIAVVLARGLETPRLALYWLAIIAFPLSLAALQTMNAGHPRYYLLAGLVLLLLLGEGAAAMLKAGGWRRLTAGAGLAAFVTTSAVANLDLYQTRRGDPGGAIRALAQRAPAGAELLIERETGIALIRVAAAEHGYPLRYATACPSRRFLFVDRFPGELMPSPRLSRCGTSYRSIASASTRGMSGQNWTLYERMD